MAEIAKPRTLLGRCRRLGHCGYIDCICDVDPTDPRDMAALRLEEVAQDATDGDLPMTKPRRDFYWKWPVDGQSWFAWAFQLWIEVDRLARRAAQLSSSGGRAWTKRRMDSPSAILTEKGERPMEKLIEKYEEEKRVMLECVRLNPRENGSSIYMQMAIIADRKANALRLAAQLQK